MKIKKYKTIWISDVHLGAKRAKAKELLDFLKHNQCKTLFIIGDLFDGWKLRKKFYWESVYTDLMIELLKIIKKGCKVIYIAGNHDEFLRNFLHKKIVIENFHIKNKYVYKSGNKKYLVIHGDQYDLVTRYQKWIAVFGDKLYGVLIFINKIFNFFRQKLGLVGQKSFSKYIKQKIKKAVAILSKYEKSLIYECRNHGYSGIICGHTHIPAIKKIDDYYYYNSGDWVESLSALVEDEKKKIELIYWNKKNS